MTNVARSLRWPDTTGALSRPRLVGVAIVVGLALALAYFNLVGVAQVLERIAVGQAAEDWMNYQVAADQWLAGADPFTSQGVYKYSPLLLPVWAALEPLGAEGWRLLHIAAALAMPRRAVVTMTLLAWPFWLDVVAGNTIVFLLLAGAWTLTGSRLGASSWLALTLLIPRPLMLPLAAWILWRRPSWRLPAALLGLAYVGAIAAVGMLQPWVGAMLRSDYELELARNLGPSAIFGLAWLIIGVPLAAWLTWRRRPLLAGLAIQPYLLGYYWMLALPALERVSRGALRAAPVSRQ